MSDKPREFWIDLATNHGDPCDFVSDKPHRYPSSTNIHVIEYSSLQAEQRKVAELKAENERLSNLESMAHEHALKADAAIEILRDAVNSSIKYGAERCDCGSEGLPERKDDHFCDCCTDSYDFQDALLKADELMNGE